MSRWFEGSFPQPTAPQARAWPAIQARRHTLIAAPTGSGKTLAAFLAAIDDLVRLGTTEAHNGGLPDETRVVYVSPLKALSNDIQRNLVEPLEGIRRELAGLGLPDVEIRTLVRTGDTPAAERAAMLRRPPHIVVTTPESLYLLLTAEKGRSLLGTVRTVIVDEIHALVGNKRGSHLALTLERLEAWVRDQRCGHPGREDGEDGDEGDLVRVGLSATQRPIAEVARFLVGGARRQEERPCTIVDMGHTRQRDLRIEVPDSPLEAVMSNEVWEEVYDRLAGLVAAHSTTLIFVNTRRLAERLSRHLSDRLGVSNITSHHGSLSREQRLMAEQRLKSGELRALVATASLELGIDIGDVDLVCQLGSPRSIASLLQRVGRSGHAVGGVAKGRLFPLSRDDLVECAALLRAVGQEELDRLRVPEKPLDILAQQIVAAVACEEWQEEDLYRWVTSAYPYRRLERQELEAVVAMLAEGFSTRHGRQRAYLHRDRVHGRLRPRRGARLTALTNGGAIPDNADFDVLLEPGGTFIGTVNEDFAIESMPGNVFQLGNMSWRILRVEPGRVRVEDAQGQPPTIPFWLGEAPGRTDELSLAVSQLRSEIGARLAGSRSGVAGSGDDGKEPGEEEAAVSWLGRESGAPPPAAQQITEYLASAQAALGVLPSQECLVLERFFDEAGGMQLVLHSPYGSRLNRAWGLALRKRFCRKFNFELQAAATDDAIVLSLGLTHSFPLAEVFSYLHPKNVREILVQALLDAPMFNVHWRWNANRSLAVPRFRGGRRVPPQIQRMNAEDLVSVVFPDQLACLENIAGDREVPDHPLIQETLRDCLEDVMDIDGLEVLLTRIHEGKVRLEARELTEPSPLALEILSARPYAFLDDAPLEERRTQAVMSRRWLDPESAAEIGALDPRAIDAVCRQAWPRVRNADELHDALVLLGFLTEEEGLRGDLEEEPDEVHDSGPSREPPPSGWQECRQELEKQGRACRLGLGDGSRPTLWIAAERLPQLRALFPAADLDPALEVPQALAHEVWTPEEALTEILRGRLEALGPTTAAALAESLGLPAAAVDSALGGLESEGFILRGSFTPSGAPGGGVEWCERRLLARIHRATVRRLRQEIQPVSAQDLVRFLIHWQHLGADERLEGPSGLEEVLSQLEGFEAAAGVWEADLLPGRLKEYDPSWLDTVCLSGKLVWLRRSRPAGTASEPSGNGRGGRPAGGRRAVAQPRGETGSGRGSGPVRSTPISLVARKNLAFWRPSPSSCESASSHLSARAQTLLEGLDSWGASFFDDLVERTGFLRTQVEEALGELVAAGEVTADSFTGLRALLVPSNRRKPLDRARGQRSRGSVALFGVEDAGRWVRLSASAPKAAQTSPARSHKTGPWLDSGHDPEAVESVAWTLLRRWGVVFRRLVQGEEALPPWRDLLRVFRRLEARGEIRGGRFVAGFSGEQFALPEAVVALRKIRRQDPTQAWVSVSASDPLNLSGTLLPGPRIPAVGSNRILFRDGLPVACRIAGEVRFLVELEPADQWQAKGALLRRPIPPRLRPYLGKAV